MDWPIEGGKSHVEPGGAEAVQGEAEDPISSTYPPETTTLEAKLRKLPTCSHITPTI